MPYSPQPLYLLDAAWQAPEVQAVLDTAYEGWLQRSALTDGQRLYHYTDLAGLRGILADRALWLTHAYALNDPAELDYGLRLVGVQIERALARHSEGSPAHQALSEVRTTVSSLYGPIHHAYVTSFCEDGDLLSQWRGYGASGGGYALGLEVSSQTRIGVPGRPLNGERHPYLRKVLYEPEEQEHLVEAFLAEFCAAVDESVEESARGLHPDERPFAPSWMGAHAANFLSDLVVSFKHRAFSEEREWRLIRVVRDNSATDELHFREARGALVPYRPAHVYDPAGEPGGRPSFPIREIVFGPTLDGRSTRASLSLLAFHEETRAHPIALSGRLEVRAAAAALR